MSLVSLSQTLPALPIALPSIHGENIDVQALQSSGGPEDSAEAMITRFRSKFSPEKCPWYRRYYLKPHRGRFGRDRFSIRYVWNFRNPKTDRTIGIINGEDLAAAQIIIGNEAAGRGMTGIRWELCEDRDGEEPIAIGRFDPWSLLRDISPADIQRLKDEKNLMPDVFNWDFDSMMLQQSCPNCHRPVSINCLAYNIDSVRCSHCGVRPFMSRCLERYWRCRFQPVETSDGEIHRPDEILAHSITWLASVGGKAAEVCCRELPEGMQSTDQVLTRLLQSSTVSNLDAPKSESAGLTLRTTDQLQKLSGGADIVTTIHGAVNALRHQIASGQPFTKVHTAMAKLLVAVSDVL